jgi:hypothetical protein
VLLLGAEEHGRSSGYTSARHGPYRHGGTEGITGSGRLILLVLLLVLYLREPSAAAPRLAGQRRRSGCWLYDETLADEEAAGGSGVAGRLPVRDGSTEYAVRVHTHAPTNRPDAAGQARIHTALA